MLPSSQAMIALRRSVEVRKTGAGSGNRSHRREEADITATLPEHPPRVAGLPWCTGVAGAIWR